MEGTAVMMKQSIKRAGGDVVMFEERSLVLSSMYRTFTLRSLQVSQPLNFPGTPTILNSMFDVMRGSFFIADAKSGTLLMFFLVGKDGMGN